MQEVDSSLRAAASQAILSLENDGGRLVFPRNEAEFSRGQTEENFALRVLSPGGEQWDGVGQAIAGLPAPPIPGYLVVDASGDNWRILTEAVPGDSGRPKGWVQVARSLVPTESLLETLRTQLYLVLPIVLVLAAIAGYLLAGRTLRPLIRISQVADAIHPGDFGRRIRYQGPRDEIGRMAGAFDRMLDRVERAFLRERRFTSDASHELRTPLTAIKGGIGVTLSRRRTPEEYETALVDLEAQVDRLIRLSTGLLSVAQAGRSRIEKPEIVDLGDLLEATVQQVEGLAAEKGIAVETIVRPNVYVVGFAEDLARVFLNLLANAIRFTEQGGRIRLAAQTGILGGARVARIDIEDTGPGIAAKDLPHIFEPFYRGSDRHFPETEGSGLGLTIAREIVVAHAGSLDVASAPGKGSTFTVRLPATSDPAAIDASTSRKMRSRRGRRQFIGRERTQI